MWLGFFLPFAEMMAMRQLKYQFQCYAMLLIYLLHMINDSIVASVHWGNVIVAEGKLFTHTNSAYPKMFYEHFVRTKFTWYAWFMQMHWDFIRRARFELISFFSFSISFFLNPFCHSVSNPYMECYSFSMCT